MGEDKEHPPFVDPPCALMYEVSTNKTSKWGWERKQRRCQALTTEITRPWLWLLSSFRSHPIAASIADGDLYLSGPG